jgi:hypothetical protein
MVVREFARFKRSGLTCIIGWDEAAKTYGGFVGVSKGTTYYGLTANHLYGLLASEVTYAGDHVSNFARFSGVWWIGVNTVQGHTSKLTGINDPTDTIKLTVVLADELGVRDPHALPPHIIAQQIHPTASGHQIGVSPTATVKATPPSGYRPKRPSPPSIPSRDVAEALRKMEASQDAPNLTLTPRDASKDIAEAVSPAPPKSKEVHITHDGTGWVVSAGGYISPFRFIGSIAAEQYAEQVAEKHRLKVVFD